jgi:2-oxoglutarate ferredoxin oxidoreductase subunit beta
MSYIRPTFRHPNLPTNKLGYHRQDYEGALSTLCAGCGHDSITAAIIQSCFELSLEPHRIAKMSGIGCSSKTPAYYLGKSHSFNTVHGRMPSVTTGANMANRDLLYLGVSGDGDTASIGMGQFAHVMRRNLNMVYVVMNNGVYGLTKGQDSATADVGSASKKGAPNKFESIDLCAMAIQLGAGFVARSFSGDKEQMVPLLKAAMSHEGFSFIDIISPCVTFNNTPSSTKGYEWVRDHLEASGTFDFVPVRDEITHTQEKGTTEAVALHDGSVIHLHKGEHDLDVRDRRSAVNALEKCKAESKILTGIIYLDEHSTDTHKMMNTSDTPLNELGKDVLTPSLDALENINEMHR